MHIRRLSAFGGSLALHVLAVASTIWLAARVTLSPYVRAEARGPTVDAAQPPEKLIGQLREASVARAQTSKAADRTPEDLGIRLDDGASNLSIPGFTFDFAKVTKRAASLFPFLTRSISLERLVATTDRPRTGGLVNPFGRPRVELSKPPLARRDAALQSLIDKSWSRRDRWKAFEPIAALVNAYDPDAGRLPDLLRGYVAQDGLQPYVDTIVRDPRLWTQLGLAADHADFIDFIGRYASGHPSTKTTTELLFLADKLVQASVDALATLLGADPAEDLRWTRGANRFAYDALVTIRNYYRTQLERRGIASRGLRTHYDQTRLDILTGILRTTPGGYRASDARFLIGTIYWRQGKTSDAARSWADMTIDPSDSYVMAYSEILDAIRASGGEKIDTRRIERILDGEHGRWISFSFERLQHFGYHFDTF
jgi:hypothetical protein